MRTNALKVIVGLGLAAALFGSPACSSDEDDGSSGAGAAGGSGGQGGSGGGTGGKGGSGGSGGGLTPAVCAGVTCEAGPTVPGIGIEVGTCCSAAVVRSRHVSLGRVNITFDPVCQERDQPGDSNASCPDSPPIGSQQVSSSHRLMDVVGRKASAGTC